MRTPAHVLVCLLLSAGLAGCGADRKPNAVETPSSDRIVGDAAASAEGSFYPLALGNTWSFSRQLKAVYTAAGQPPVTLTDGTTPVQTDLMCTETLGGLSYVVERSVEDGVSDYVRMRQDGSGLYEADVSTQTVPVCATGAAQASSMKSRDVGAVIAQQLSRVASSPAELAALSRAWEDVEAQLAAVRAVIGPHAAYSAGSPTALAAGEITRLRYPMRKGQSWVIRESPRYTAVVEATENLKTAAGSIGAYRVRIDSELFAPGSSVLMWQSKQGFIGLTSHIESILTDASGNPTGSIVTDDVLTLTGLTLAKGGK
jgi:hypothetical protein